MSDNSLFERSRFQGLPPNTIEYLQSFSQPEKEILLSDWWKEEAIADFLSRVRIRAQRALMAEDDIWAEKLVQFITKLQHDEGEQGNTALPDNVIEFDFNADSRI